DLLRRKAGPLDVGGRAVDAINAIINAEIGQQDLQQGDAAAIGGIGMTNAAAAGRTDATGLPAGAFDRAARSAGSVVFGGVREDREFALQGQLDHCSLFVLVAFVAEAP